MLEPEFGRILAPTMTAVVTGVKERGSEAERKDRNLRKRCVGRSPSWVDIRVI